MNNLYKLHPVTTRASPFVQNFSYDIYQAIKE